MRRLNVAVFLMSVLLPGAAFAQFGREWTTSGNDAQRSNWLRTSLLTSPRSSTTPARISPLRIFSPCS